MKRLSQLAACLLLVGGSGLVSARAPPPAGESIYLRGELPSGTALQGRRDSGVNVQGADAACVSCHQRSGLGSEEGGSSIPPITGEYLFQTRSHGGHDVAVPYVEGMRGNRDPYTEATLARAIREGLDSQGRLLSPLMPRYALSDSDLASLVAYLKSLTPRRVPGVSDTVLQFATIVTPDADPVKRSGVLDVLEHYVAEKNSFPFGPTPKMWTSGHTAYSKSMYMANRRWQLHVWQLSGAAATWRAQLEQDFAREPVYAVLSGVGGSNWRPVHEFCEQHGVPCLFPNVEVPVVDDGTFYSLYFSKGVLLEAQLMAKAIAAAPRSSRGEVQQVYRAGDSGEAAAAMLAQALEQEGITVRSRRLAASAREREVAAAIVGGAEAPVLVLWLRGPDLAALESARPGRGRVYLSGLMGGLENAPLPQNWREHVTLTYPFDLPQSRGVRLDYPLGWFAFRHIPVVALQSQADTYLACSLVADVLHHMADNFSPPYLIEQLQNLVEHRIITGYYPRLTLATHQRFASKGGYLVHFGSPQGSDLVADTNWTVP